MLTFAHTVWFKVAALAVAFGIGWTANGWRLGSTVAELNAKDSKGLAVRAEAARVDSEATGRLEIKHAERTIYNADKLASIKTSIAIDMRSIAVITDSLQRDHAQRAATYRAQAAADQAARDDLANKAAALDARIVSGRQVVEGFTARLRERDAEVSALCEQVNTERALLGDTSNSACSQ